MRKSKPKPDPADAVLVKKHPLAIRWFHWINFPVLSIMVWSGLLIFYANRNGVITFFGKPVFPDWFYAPPAPHWIPNWVPTAMSHGDRVFYMMSGRLAEGLAWHWVIMWAFALNGLAYALYLFFSKEWRSVVPCVSSFKTALLVALSDLHLVPEPKSDGKYNDAQKVAYTGVIVLGLIMLLSGFAIYKPTQAFWLTGLFGGYVMARWFHFWATMLLCGFFLVHVAQVIRAGWNNFRGMLTGYVLEYRTREVEPPAEPAGDEEAA